MQTGIPLHTIFEVYSNNYMKQPTHTTLGFTSWKELFLKSNVFDLDENNVVKIRPTRFSEKETEEVLNLWRSTTGTLLNLFCLASFTNCISLLMKQNLRPRPVAF